MYNSHPWSFWVFLPTPSARRATQVGKYSAILAADFYPRPPRGGRPASLAEDMAILNDFYPRPPRGGRPPADQRRGRLLAISTHALREEGDACRIQLVDQLVPISTHALREEGDPSSGLTASRMAISTHALREEGDVELIFCDHCSDEISTHALREEGDSGAPCCRVRPCNFYPRPPRGGRRLSHALGRRPCHFYPRPPRGGRRLQVDALTAGFDISTHALREEGDSSLPALPSAW